MKLDNDLVRSILLQVEADADGNKNYPIKEYCESKFLCDVKVSTYHVKYLIDAGFIQASNGYIFDITPSGRDFLNNIRDEDIWKETKKAVKPLGTVAINVVSQIAASIVKKTFNLP